MTITSYIPGRIRVRDERLANKADTEPLISILKQLPGINNIVLNHRTSSMLIQYDPASGVEDLLKSHCDLMDAGEPVKSAKKQPLSSRKKCNSTASCLPFSYRQFLNYGMMITFAASGWGVAIHYRKLHKVAGFLFFGLSGLHMYNKRKTLFT